MDDFTAIVRHFGVDKSRLAAELTRSLDKLKSGNARTPALSPSVSEDDDRGLDARLDRIRRRQVRTGFTMLALVSNEELSRIMREVSKELQKIEPESLRKDFQIVSTLHGRGTGSPRLRSSGGNARPAGGGKTPNLDQYTVNLTENARKGKIDPVLAPRFRDPAGNRHPDPPPAEQSHPGG